jgi:hypothetical protein
MRSRRASLSEGRWRMVGLLLSTAALVMLTALGAGALLYATASTTEADEGGSADPPPRLSFEPDERDRPQRTGGKNHG